MNTQKVFIVNNKRKTVTVTKISNLTNYEIPPFEIFKRSNELKSYLIENQSILNKRLSNSNEIWKYSKNKQLYLIEIKIPEFSVLKVEIFSNNTKKIAFKILSKKTQSKDQFTDDAFIVPNSFKRIYL